MGEVIYKELINDMTWSYSRISCFDECPYRWFLKYISMCQPIPQFYSSYGKFMHKLIEQFYKGILTKEDMLNVFLTDFTREVRGDRPPASTVEKYIKAGIDYLSRFQPFPYKLVAVEELLRFNIDGQPFVGIVDFIGEKNGELYVVDNKSRDLKPRSKRKKPTLKDIELDEMLRQLYIYSAAVKEKYGKFPKSLCFNCFKSGVFIEEPFDIEAYENAIAWAKCNIEAIKNTEDFEPYIDWFACKNICDVNYQCCYFN